MNEKSASKKPAGFCSFSLKKWETRDWKAALSFHLLRLALALQSLRPEIGPLLPPPLWASPIVRDSEEVLGKPALTGRGSNAFRSIYLTILRQRLRSKKENLPTRATMKFEGFPRYTEKKIISSSSRVFTIPHSNYSLIIACMAASNLIRRLFYYVPFY